MISAVKFFNLGDKFGSVKDGQKICLKSLFGQYKRKRLFGLKRKNSTKYYRQVFADDRLVLKEQDHIYWKDPVRWQKIISTIVFVISGRVPDMFDSKRFYAIITEIRKSFKNQPEILSFVDSPTFIFGSFPYFLAGFDFLRKNGWSCNGKNNLKNFCCFIEKIVKEKDVSVSTYLCAHREHEPLLSKDIDLEGLRKMTNIISGITENIFEKKKIKLEIFQQCGSGFSINAVFPEIFLAYLGDGKLLDLMDTLQKHYDECRRYFYQLAKSRNLTIKLFSIDRHIKKVEKYVQKFSQNDLSGTSRIFLMNETRRIQNDNVREKRHIMAVSKFALEEIKRLMPYYTSFGKISSNLIHTNINKARDKQKKILITESIRRFINTDTLESKAVYETVFYFLWGKEARRKKQIIVGFERDHDIYQTMAISKGYLGYKSDNSNNKYGAPLLYARRVDPAYDDGISFRKISFRQFWRLSERNFR